MSKLNANSVELGSLTTTQRNALTGVTAGTTIYNSTTGTGQVYNGTSWVDFGNSAQFLATGGTTVTSGSYTYHVFTSPGTFSVTSGNRSIDYVVVGSGAGGASLDGGNGGGGGGGGGVVYAPGYTVAAGSFPITVGTGQPINVGTTQAPASSAFVTTAPGGTSGTGNSGSDGGPSGNGLSGGAGTLNAGCGGVRAGGGGGGAGAVGGNWSDSSPDIGGNGGAGLAVPAFPGPVFSPIMPAPWVSAVGPTGLFGGGGGGADERDTGGGAGGPGGGGKGGDYPSNGVAGVTNTGGGGGGHGGRGCVIGRSGGVGASGIVIIRYLT